MEEQSSVVYKGWLVKSPPDQHRQVQQRGRRRFFSRPKRFLPKWRRRYFVLLRYGGSGRLQYYEDELQCKPKGTIDLAQARAIVTRIVPPPQALTTLSSKLLTESPGPSSFFSLEIESSRRTRIFYFLADSVTQMDRWVDSLIEVSHLPERTNSPNSAEIGASSGRRHPSSSVQFPGSNEQFLPSSEQLSSSSAFFPGYAEKHFPDEQQRQHQLQQPGEFKKLTDADSVYRTPAQEDPYRLPEEPQYINLSATTTHVQLEPRSPQQQQPPVTAAAAPTLQDSPPAEMSVSQQIEYMNVVQLSPLSRVFSSRRDPRQQQRQLSEEDFGVELPMPRRKPRDSKSSESSSDSDAFSSDSGANDVAEAGARTMSPVQANYARLDIEQLQRRKPQAGSGVGAAGGGSVGGSVGVGGRTQRVEYFVVDSNRTQAIAEIFTNK